MSDKKIEGSCIYVDSKVQHLADAKNDLFQKINFNDPRIMSQTVPNLTSGAELFMKHKKYQHQRGHRLTWFSEQKIKKDFVRNCPEASAHCEKIVF